MRPIVLKFGGSSLNDREKFLFIARKIISIKKKYRAPVACVLSAPAEITDNLLKTSSRFKPNIREQDALACLGEQLSVSLMAMAIGDLGHKAISFNSWQLPIKGRGEFGNGEIISVGLSKIKKAFLQGKIVLITGFQAINKSGEIMTLGRGGSDLSAVALSRFLNAEKCFLFSDVKGVYSANPSVVSEAIKLPTVSYDEIIALAETGTEVRQLKAVKYAREHNIKIHFASSIGKDEGTLISSTASERKVSCLSFSQNEDMAMIAIIGRNVEKNIQINKALFEIARKAGIKILSIKKGPSRIIASALTERARELLLAIHKKFIR
ncbi:MAG: hypothetical protein Fur0012_01260 [Elusimicrobiota bacterium]